MSYSQRIADQLKINPRQINAAVELLDAGNTIPFISRYRKEVTGSLDEEQLRQVSDSLAKLRALDDRRDSIKKIIVEQEQMTPALAKLLDAAATLTELEDLYQPFKRKRTTRAGVARAKGLEPLAMLIIKQSRDRKSITDIAKQFINKDVPTATDALDGARDIVAELISENPQVRQRTREKAMRYGYLCAKLAKNAEDPRDVYKLYYDFEYQVDRVRPHQLLAINRGESEKVLSVKVDLAERDWLIPMRTVFRPDYQASPWAEQLSLAMQDAASRLLLPAIERDVRRALTEMAESHAISVFASNLRALLSQPPLVGHVALAIDPGFRTGCKVAVVDSTGKSLETATIYPHAPQKRWNEAVKLLSTLITRHQVTLIAVGNGTASRETEQLAAELAQKFRRVNYLIVNEAGASVYSASPLARAELPDMDVTLRGAVSIGRRAQDPLAELVKIDPKSIGVGLYQHDVNQKQLSEGLTGVVESVVNQVGVDVNTASPALLTFVSGIGPKLAEGIVAHRDEQGRFPDRASLKAVRGLGNKAFEQSAGFLRVNGGTNPLDASAIHPESYKVATTVLKLAKIAPSAAPEATEAALAQLTAKIPLEKLAETAAAGLPTLVDILEQLARPGRDPRADLPAPILRSDVLSMDDLKQGMRLKGTVRNVVDFGSFVDIGVKQDGLLHRSQLPRNVRLQVGDIIEVEILSIEQERGRIALGWT